MWTNSSHIYTFDKIIAYFNNSDDNRKWQNYFQGISAQPERYRYLFAALAEIVDLASN